MKNTPNSYLAINDKYKSYIKRGTKTIVIIILSVMLVLSLLFSFMCFSIARNFYKQIQQQMVILESYQKQLKEEKFFKEMYKSKVDCQRGEIYELKYEIEVLKGSLKRNKK